MKTEAETVHFGQMFPLPCCDCHLMLMGGWLRSVRMRKFSKSGLRRKAGLWDVSGRLGEFMLWPLSNLDISKIWSCTLLRTVNQSGGGVIVVRGTYLLLTLSSGRLECYWPLREGRREGSPSLAFHCLYHAMTSISFSPSFLVQVVTGLSLTANGWEVLKNE